MPNFGYETIGSSIDTISTATYERIFGALFTITANGTADSMTVALRRVAAGSNKVKCAIYKHSDSSFVGATEEKLLDLTTTFAWYSFNFTGTKPSLTANIGYVLVVWADYTVQDIKIAYTLDISHPDHRHEGLAYNGFPATATFLTWGGDKASIYCTYTADGAPTAKSFSDVGAGSDGFLNPYRAMPFSEVGHGGESFGIPFKALPFADVCQGVDAFNTPFRAMGFSDVGNGADIFALLRALAFTDVGHGTDAFSIPFKGLAFSDVGHGSDAFTTPFRAMLFTDTGQGIDVFVIPFKALGFADVGAASDSYLNEILAAALHKWGIVLPFRLLQKYLATGRAVYLESLKKKMTGKSVHPKRLNLEAHGTAVKPVRTDLTIEFQTVRKALNLQGYGKAIRPIQTKGNLQGRKIEQVTAQLPVTGKQRFDLVLELLGIELTLTYMFVAVVDDKSCEDCMQHDTKHFTREQIDIQFPNRDDTDYTLILPNSHNHCRCMLILLEAGI